MNQILVPAILLTGVALCAADPVRAVLTPPGERRTAGAIQLNDHLGRPVDLASYRGQVVLVDFWATWCGGCKQELPWFQEFESKYGGRKFAVVGVSMDREGWSVVKPFLDSVKVGFKVVIDDVDRDNMEANIRLLLAEK
jgi:thiol-disulfide isomerase/thioredoxin